MPLLCYNMYVIDMNNEYNYYVKTIKPIEKEYNKYCKLYDLFKINFFKEQKEYNNLLLIAYYKAIINNPNYAKKLLENINKKNNRKS